MVRAVVQFALTGVAAVALFGVVAAQILQNTARGEAIRDAKNETRMAGEGIAGPFITNGLLEAQPATIARLDRVVRERVLRPPVVRVKIWDGSGRILYSDARALIGSRYRLRPDELSALRAGTIDAEISDLSKPENRYERSQHKLLEVYMGVRTPNGTPLLYEDYLQYSSIAASQDRIWSSFAPALIAVLVLLELVQIPLAWSLARRLSRGQEEREALLRRAIDSSELERQRVASDLHDGVVQNLAGVSYTLSAAAEQLRGKAPPEALAMVETAAGETQDSIRELRTLLVDIYPATLRRAGLLAALTDLVTPLSARLINVELDIESALELAPDDERLLYRAAQEAVRNVAKHARATRVRISASRNNGTVVLCVEDDGHGFVPGQASANGGRRHFGLRILADLAQNAGGELTIDSAPGSGTRVRLEVPVH